jgi:protein-tyrosine-phosphatase
MDFKTDLELRVAVNREIGRLTSEFRGIFSQQTIDRSVDESFESLTRGARLRLMIPTLTYRLAKERLQALGQVEGLINKDRPEVLFVCVHNAGRSQMAAALTHSLSGGRVSVRSAGSTPADELNPAVVQAMAEIGLDISEEFPKPLSDEVVRAADAVITMGCGDACPLYPGKKYEDWELDDPAGQPIEVVRAIREDVKGRVQKLLAELGVAVG